MWRFIGSVGFVFVLAGCGITGPGGPGDGEPAGTTSGRGAGSATTGPGSGGGATTSTGTAGSGGSGGVPGPMGLPVLGNGEHTPESVLIDQPGAHADGLRLPNDLAFNPQSPNELWVVNSEDDSVTVLLDAGMGSQQAENFWGQDSNHFLANPSGIAFGDNGYFATIHQEDEKTQSFTPWDFMGPTLWKGNINEFDAAHATHYDMLHNSPNGMGIAWEQNNTYWVFDGENSSLTRYKFNQTHGPGGSDHSDGVIQRFVQGEVSRVAGVVSHMEYISGMLYVADTGNNRIAVLDTSTGSEGSNTTPNHDGVDQYRMDGATITTLIDGNQFGMTHPSGLAIVDSVIYVTDNATSKIHGFSMTGEELDWLDTGVPAGCLQGITMGPNGGLWTVDAPNNAVLRIMPKGDGETQ